MRFNLYRFVGILAVGIAAFLLFSLQHWDPGNYIQHLIDHKFTLFWAYIAALIVAAVFLSTEKEKKE